MAKTCVYAGTFDPITLGHLDIIERALKIFDKVIVAVTNNPNKKTTFPTQERVEKIKQCTTNNVEVESFTGLLVNYMKQKQCNIILRGLRVISDFDYEFQLSSANRTLHTDIETVFIMTDQKYSFLSSSGVKEIASLGGDISRFVPKEVKEKLYKLKK